MSESNVNTELVTDAQPNLDIRTPYDTLDLFSRNLISKSELVDLAVDQANPEQIKSLFVLMAQVELDKLFNYIKLLKKCEEKFQYLVESQLEEVRDFLTIMELIKFIHYSFDRSFAMIQKITNDQSIIAFFIDNRQVVQSSVNSMINISTDHESRGRVLETVTKLISNLGSLEGINLEELLAHKKSEAKESE